MDQLSLQTTDLQELAAEQPWPWLQVLKEWTLHQEDSKGQPRAEQPVLRFLLH
jgi:hypothetical protein